MSLVALGKPFQRRAKTKLCEITMDGHARLLLKYARTDETAKRELRERHRRA